MQDIANCVTPDNCKGFIEDFKQVIACVLMMNEINKQLIKDGTIPEGSTIKFPSFTWIDDKKPKRKR